jgi:hypothetical protein
MRNKSSIIVLKRIATFFLLVSFFLPMSKSCSKADIPNTTSKPLFVLVDETPETVYAWDVISSSFSKLEQILYLALIFLWPVPFLVFSRQRKKILLYLRIGVELFTGVIASHFYVILNIFSGNFMVGGYLYFLATILYMGTTLVELLQNIMSHIREVKAFRASSSDP